MKLSSITAFSTEGAPMLVGDAESAQHWRGALDDGTGVVITFWAQGMAKLPAKLKKAKKKTKAGHALQVKLASSEEADEYERELLEAMLRVHPGAARPPPYPQYPVWYLGDYRENRRVFGIERSFTSAYDAMLKKLKSDVAAVVIDKKAKAKVLFFEMEGGGPGVIAADPEHHTLVVAKITVAAGDSQSALVGALESTKLAKVKPAGKIRLGDRAVVFDSARAASAVAAHNFSEPNLASALASITAPGPLRIPDQAVAGGAFLRWPPGDHHYAVVRDASAGKASYRALWLWA